MVCIFLDQEFLYYLNTVYTEFYFNENKLKDRHWPKEKKNKKLYF